MATAQSTTDHEEIRDWVESRDGHPAVVEGTGVLRIDFGEPEPNLEQIDWNEFFDIFERSNLAFLYDPRGHMVKFVERKANMARGNGRRKSTSGRKKSTRKKSTGGRKKSTGGRKKTTGGRKKSTGGRKKSTGGRKKSSSGRKYGPKASRKVERSMHEMKRGELKSGRSGKKVTSRKQAIAIGLSEARRSGGKVPKRKSSSRKKSR